MTDAQGITKKKKKSRLTIKHIKSAAPFIQAGLALASKVKKIRPYTQLVNAVIGMGAEALPDEQKELLLRIKTLREHIRIAETGGATPALHAKMDLLIDELIEKSNI